MWASIWSGDILDSYFFHGSVCGCKWFCLSYKIIYYMKIKTSFVNGAPQHNSLIDFSVWGIVENKSFWSKALRFRTIESSQK